MLMGQRVGTKRCRDVTLVLNVPGRCSATPFEKALFRALHLEDLQFSVSLKHCVF